MPRHGFLQELSWQVTEGWADRTSVGAGHEAGQEEGSGCRGQVGDRVWSTLPVMGLEREAMWSEAEEDSWSKWSR